MADQERQEFMAHVLEELRKVEGAESPERSIYSLGRGAQVVVTDSERPAFDLLDIATARPTHTFSRMGRIDGLRLSGRALGVCTLGRRFTLPIELSRMGERYETPWIGYNYVAIHKAVVKFVQQVAASREAQRRYRDAIGQRQASLVAAIDRGTTREVRQEGNDIFVALYEGVLARIDAVNGGFTVRGKVTAENVSAVLDALEALHRALGTKPGQLV